jgi:NAD(P)-dependent dehydrogenase (short-subunit alcohol dehydrogenase family)
MSTTGRGGIGEKNLAGRTALVTGGARRIGRTLVLALARAGARVVIHYRNSEAEARTALESARALGITAELVRADLADPAAAAGLVDEAARILGIPDILVNNASVFDQGDFQKTSLQVWELNQAVNLRAPFLLSQAFARRLPADRPGDIVNLNDYRALRPGSDHFPYTISKVGLHGLTRSLAQALAPRIRVNELALGAILPPEQAPAEYEHTLRSQIPTARFGTLEEVADALLFLLGNASLTGQTVCVDGGRHLV